MAALAGTLQPGRGEDYHSASGGKAVLVPGSGRQRIAPLYVDDVAAALLGALTRPDAPVGVVDLGGPEEMTIDDFVRTLKGGAARIRHLPESLARLSARLFPSLTQALMDLMLRDNVVATDPAGIGTRLGFTPHRPVEVWAAEPGP